MQLSSKVHTHLIQYTIPIPRFKRLRIRENMVICPTIHLGVSMHDKNNFHVDLSRHCRRNSDYVSVGISRKFNRLTVKHFSGCAEFHDRLRTFLQKCSPQTSCFWIYQKSFWWDLKQELRRLANYGDICARAEEKSAPEVRNFMAKDMHNTNLTIEQELLVKVLVTWP